MPEPTKRATLRDVAAGAGVSVAQASFALDGTGRVDEGGAATGDDALLDRGPGRGHGVLDPVLLLLELDLGGRADLDHADAAGELGDPLLQLLAVPVGVGALDLGLQLSDAGLDLLALAGTVDDGGVVLRHHDAAGPAQLLETDLVELEPDLGRHHGAAGETKNGHRVSVTFDRCGGRSGSWPRRRDNCSARP